jgi:hypothetical protein
MSESPLITTRYESVPVPAGPTETWYAVELAGQVRVLGACLTAVYPPPLSPRIHIEALLHRTMETIALRNRLRARYNRRGSNPATP